MDDAVKIIVTVYFFSYIFSNTVLPYCETSHHGHYEVSMMYGFTWIIPPFTVLNGWC